MLRKHRIILSVRLKGIFRELMFKLGLSKLREMLKNRRGMCFTWRESVYAKTWRLEHGEVRAETRSLILKIRVPRSSDFNLSGEWNPVEVFR